MSELKGGEGAAPWPELSRTPVADFEVFRVERVRARSPRTGEARTFHVLRLPDWVNVVAETEDGRIVMVEQFRHGAGESTLEFPAGVVERGEDACAAGRRELEEETGYRATALSLLGRVQPNSALQDNELAVVRASACTPSGRQALDPGEDLVVRLLAPEEVSMQVRDGRIRHALALVTWDLYLKAREVG